MKFAALLSTLFFVLGATAHGGVHFYNINGKEYEGFRPYNNPAGQSSIQRVWLTHSPILNVNSPTIACNNNGRLTDGHKTAPATAGSKIKLSYNKDWTHKTGPAIVYLAKCPGSSCDNANVNQLQFFKIAERGLISGNVKTGLWSNGQMIKDGWTWSINLPSNIPNGAYMIRTELIALHEPRKPQLYPQCAQLQITGGHNVTVPSKYLVKFPGAYKQSDASLQLDIYNGQATKTMKYTIPGPALYTGKDATNAPAPSQDPKPDPKPTTTPKPSTTQSSPKPPTATKPPSALQTVWGQCAGTKWNGPTKCPGNTYCKEINESYSQCTPNKANVVPGKRCPATGKRDNISEAPVRRAHVQRSERLPRSH